MTNRSQHEGPATFIERLRQAGFFHYYSLLGDGNLRSYDWEKLSAKLPAEVLPLWQFFLLGGKLSPAALRRLLGAPGLAFLLEHKLAGRVGKALTLGSLSLVSFRGFSFFVDRRKATRAYFGHETMALLNLLPPMEQGSCLCLHPASGAEAMGLAAKPGVAVSFARVQCEPGIVAANLALNSLAERSRFLASDRECAAGAYDLVLGCVPSMFEAPGVKLPTQVSGGPDGLRWVKGALRLGTKALAPGGELALTFLFFAPPSSKAMEEKLRAALGAFPLSYSLIIGSKILMEPGLPLFNEMIALGTQGRPTRARAVIEKLLKHIKRKKLGAVYLVRGRFRKDPRRARQHIVDYSDLYYGGWTF